jgi:hypothetical protein
MRIHHKFIFLPSSTGRLTPACFTRFGIGIGNGARLFMAGLRLFSFRLPLLLFSYRKQLKV